MRIFGREPALALGVIQAGLSLLVGFKLHWLSADQATLVVALVAAISAAVAAWSTRPWAPGAFTAVIGAGAALLSGYGFDASPEVVASLSATVTALLLFLGTRPQVTPVETPPA